jgi:hypothetical protein
MSSPRDDENRPPNTTERASADPEPLDTVINSLLRCIPALPELDMRAAVLSERLQKMDARRVAAVMDGLLEARNTSKPGVRETVTALLTVLDRGLLSYDFLAAVYAEAKAHHLGPLATALLSTPVNAAQKEAAARPLLPGGRKITLGERKALARKPDRALLERLIKDADPRVIRIVLKNPLLVEQDVIAIATRRPIRAEILAELARAERWVARPRVRRALVLNPNCPPALALKQLSLLKKQELREVMRSRNLAPSIIEAAQRLLQNKTGHSAR